MYVCVFVHVLRHPYSSSPLGQSGMLSQRNSVGMHMFLAQRNCVSSQPVCGSIVPGIKLPQSSSSEPSTQSASPSQHQLWETHSNKYIHWNCPESHVGGTGVTGAEETVKYNKNDNQFFNIFPSPIYSQVIRNKVQSLSKNIFLIYSFDIHCAMYTKLNIGKMVVKMQLTLKLLQKRKKQNGRCRCCTSYSTLLGE